jgi:hypothetical protein
MISAPGMDVVEVGVVVDEDGPAVVEVDPHVAHIVVEVNAVVVVEDGPVVVVVDAVVVAVPGTTSIVSCPPPGQA